MAYDDDLEWGNKAPGEPKHHTMDIELPWKHYCDRCGHAVDKTPCKEICPNCGARRDCSDVVTGQQNG